MLESELEAKVKAFSLENEELKSESDAEKELLRSELEAKLSALGREKEELKSGKEHD